MPLSKQTHFLLTQTLILSILIGLLLANVSKAQIVESSIYFCKDHEGLLSLSNIKKTSNCIERKVLTNTYQRKFSHVGRTKDPLPHRANNSIIIPENVQLQRDVTRSAILKSELTQAQNTLNSLQKEYQNGSPKRLGNEKNHQKYITRVEKLKLRITETQSNVEALQREIERET